MKNTVFVLANGASSSRPRRTSANQQHGILLAALIKARLLPSAWTGFARLVHFYGLHVGVVYRQRPVRLSLLKKTLSGSSADEATCVTLQATVQPDGLLESSGWKHMHVCLMADLSCVYISHLFCGYKIVLKLCF